MGVFLYIRVRFLARLMSFIRLLLASSGKTRSWSEVLRWYYRKFRLRIEVDNDPASFSDGLRRKVTLAHEHFMQILHGPVEGCAHGLGAGFI